MTLNMVLGSFQKKKTSVTVRITIVSEMLLTFVVNISSNNNLNVSFYVLDLIDFVKTFSLYFTLLSETGHKSK